MIGTVSDRCKPDADDEFCDGNDLARVRKKVLSQAVAVGIAVLNEQDAEKVYQAARSKRIQVERDLRVVATKYAAMVTKTNENGV